jgi:hypothetical protein
MKESPASEYYKLRAISYLPHLPATKVEYQTGKYPFPTLVLGITTNVIALGTSPDKSFVQQYFNVRDSPSVPALYRVTTTFYSSIPTPDTLYALNTQNLAYRGISFSVSINSVLNDLIICSATFSGDPNFGNLSEAVSFSATVPSATQYLALIGTYVVAGSDITRWRGAIYVKQTQEVLLV